MNSIPSNTHSHFILFSYFLMLSLYFSFLEAPLEVCLACPLFPVSRLPCSRDWSCPASLWPRVSPCPGSRSTSWLWPTVPLPAWLPLLRAAWGGPLLVQTLRSWGWPMLVLFQFSFFCNFSQEIFNITQELSKNQKVNVLLIFWSRFVNLEISCFFFLVWKFELNYTSNCSSLT